MKINTDARVQEAVASGKSFDQQLTEARASGRPFGIVHDMRFGRHVVYQSAEELADCAARAAEEVTQREAIEEVQATAQRREQAIDAMLAEAALDPLAPQKVKDYARTKAS